MKIEVRLGFRKSFHHQGGREQLPLSSIPLTLESQSGFQGALRLPFNVQTFHAIDGDVSVHGALLVVFCGPSTIEMYFGVFPGRWRTEFRPLGQKRFQRMMVESHGEKGNVPFSALGIHHPMPPHTSTSMGALAHLQVAVPHTQLLVVIFRIQVQRHAVIFEGHGFPSP